MKLNKFVINLYHTKNIFHSSIKMVEFCMVCMMNFHKYNGGWLRYITCRSQITVFQLFLKRKILKKTLTFPKYRYSENFLFIILSCLSFLLWFTHTITSLHWLMHAQLWFWWQILLRSLQSMKEILNGVLINMVNYSMW